MTKYFIALEPEESLSNQIKSHKDIVRLKFGNQKWVDHPPKITVFVLDTDKESELIERLLSISASISGTNLSLEGVSLFESDPRSSGITISYSLSNSDISQLRKVQMNIINSINHLNDKNSFFSEINRDLLSPQEMRNMAEYGYPYVGDNWIPHFTLASVEGSIVKEILHQVSLKPIIGDYYLSKLSLYKGLDDPKLVQCWNLNNAFSELKKQVRKANQDLELNGLVKLMFGNVSALSADGKSMAIKPSGVPYNELQDKDIVVLDLNGKVLDGNLKPSSDTQTHLEIYKKFKGVGAVIHTHSPNATVFAQAKIPIQCHGTTHADHFHGPIPISRDLSDQEIGENYELNTGKAIVETFQEMGLDPVEIPACLVPYHGSFVWGKDLTEALENAIALEEVSRMKLEMLKINPHASQLPKALLDKHYKRKHGSGAYYGQK